MKLTIFYADKGDSLLLTSKDGHSILCDGGTPRGYRESVRPQLQKHLPSKGHLDVVYVSHIDDDHIGGVLGLLDDAMDWKIFDVHQKAGDAHFKAPKVPRPPGIGELWHNAFHELLPDNKGPIRDLLAANALALRLVSAPWARFAGAYSAAIVNSIPQAIRVSRRVNKNQLAIPLNKPAKGKLMLVGKKGDGADVGKMRVTPIGPAEADLDKLRKDWNCWLRKNRTTLDKIRDEARADEDRLETTFPASDAAALAIAMKALGDRNSVTPPNLASLMLHVEEGGKTVLLTGDGHSRDVEAGLEATGKVAAGKGLHTTVLKIPHHGSEHNTEEKFPPRVTADHYVFCGNGFVTNPELDVIRAYLDSRLGPAKKRSKNPEAAKPFHFWFSASPRIVPPNYKTHMRKVEKLVRDAAAASSGKLTAHFLETDPLVIDLT